MTDIFFPADLVPTSMLFGVDDFTAVDESATTGAMQSSTLFGTRRWHLRMDFAVLTGSRLARFEALVAALRGRQNRVWVSPLRAARGSFPDVELVPNNTFANGTTGWGTFNAQSVLSAQDRTLRIGRSAASAGYGLDTGVTLTLNIPYAVRAIVLAGAGPAVFRLNLVASSWFVDVPFAGNYCSFAGVPAIVAGAGMSLYENTATGGIAGDFFDVPWGSVSRCALVDNGANMLLWSDDFTNAAWTKTRSSTSLSAAIAPDGTITADSLIEDTSTNTHYVQQNFTVSSSAQDVCFTACANSATRFWINLALIENTGGTFASVYFNTSTGVIGTTNTGANWTNIRSYIKSLGNGWYQCTIVARKTNAATSLGVLLSLASADNVNTYTGASFGLQIWRATVALSSVPVRLVQSIGTAFAALAQTGNALRIKGLPVSTSGLLLAGDMVEIDLPTNSQLVRVTARLDSDAAGLGLLQFENTLKQSPADSAAVIIQQPMGRFVLAGSTLGVEYTPGVFGQASLEFVEAA
ncbi:MAG TPA: hypothetical protein VGL45_09955 [Bradyrhizobium sp.]|jgi:hypothetical protein